VSRNLLLLLPALVLPAQAFDLPGATEVRPGLFVLKGATDEATRATMKRLHITHVIDLRRDGEPNLDCEQESSSLQDLGIQYLRYAITRTPPAVDFDFLRAFLRDLPRGTKVVIHCNDGNRASAVACAVLVMDKGVPLAEALRISRDAGLKFPETESALRRYLGSKGKA
jgi:hypothetical protein